MPINAGNLHFSCSLLVMLMIYTLMHKNIPVAELTFADHAVAITSIGMIHNPAHIPLGVMSMKGETDIDELNEWLRGRSIPASRSGINDLYTHLNKNTTEHLILKCYGLSLTDHYWIKPDRSQLEWEKINFFQNNFTDDMGEMLFGRMPADRNNISLMSPDNTTDGWLKKKWIISNGKRLLVKGGSEPWKQEPFNEVVAAAIMRRLGIYHVSYSLIFENGDPLCTCENFINPETEFVSAWRVLHSIAINDGDTDFTHISRCCDELGIPGVRTFIDKLLTLDYIISNEDRHYNNFGFLRNPETLEWYGAAPVFDSGTSLWHSTLNVGESRKCRPFAATHDEQIELISDLKWFDPELLSGLKNEILEIFSASALINKNRAESIAGAVINKIENIKNRM